MSDKFDDNNRVYSSINARRFVVVRIKNLAFMQKRITLVLSAIAAITAGISILNTLSAQAVIITGSVTGTWVKRHLRVV